MLILDHPPRYRTYLVRGQPVHNAPADEEVRWWFSLEDPQSGQRHNFTSFALLVAFLTAQFGEVATASPTQDGQAPTLPPEG